MRVYAALTPRVPHTAHAQLLLLGLITSIVPFVGSCSGESSTLPTPETGTTAPPTAGKPFRNPNLADSNWPIFHADVYASASSATLAPAVLGQVQIIDALTASARGPFVSPWTLHGERYADGSQPVLTTPADGVAKYLIDGDRFEGIDFLPLERDVRDFDWGILLLRGGDGVVTERRTNRFVIFGDERAGDPLSPLVVKQRIDVDLARYGGLLAHHSLAPDGSLIALTDANRLIAIDLVAGRVIADFALPSSSGASFQNSFPIDENGRIFVAAQSLTAAIDWDGTRFILAWSARYDMRGPGCEDVPPDRPSLEEMLAVANGEPCTGTGTTPSLLGAPEDGVAVIVDGHNPRNNLVAFWRDGPPTNWQALPDPNAPGEFLDRQIAGVFALPLSTPAGDGFTAQNSPAVSGNAIVVAQWAGFNPAADAPRGVQRVDWRPDAQRFELAWTNPDIHFNGVPTIACTDEIGCQAYGMGRYGRRYSYSSLDFDTGAETGRLFLGFTDAVLDQGNNHAVADDGSIVFGARATLIRVR